MSIIEAVLWLIQKDKHNIFYGDEEYFEGPGVVSRLSNDRNPH